jgi:hypothetical protein
MAFPKSVKQLCTPAYIYFLLSVICIIITIIQNVGNRRTYSLSSMSVPVPSTIMVFVVKIIGILFWTWVLNLMCKDGHNEIAWFLVLLPFVLLFFMMGTAEGFQTAGSYKRPIPPEGSPTLSICQGKCHKTKIDAALCDSNDCRNRTGNNNCPTQSRCETVKKDFALCSECKE